jgi:subtilase family serine protease
MNKSNRGRMALLLVATLLLQGALVGPLASAGSTEGDEHRLPSGYLTVFQDDFDAGVLDPSKWLFWEGKWSTDNVAVNPSGGYYTGDEVYLTESPYVNGFGDPLDDNGNFGDYYPDEVAMIETTWIDLINITAPRLEFSHMFNIPSKGDGAMVFVMSDRDQEWELVQPEVMYPETTGWSGNLQTWINVGFRLDDYAGLRIRIGFYLRSAPDNIEGDGWKIDDIKVGGRSDQQMADLKLGNVRVLLDGYPVDAAVAGDVLVFNMTIINEGRANVDAYVVTAYTDHPLKGGVEIGRSVVLDGLSVGMSSAINMRWIATAGRYDTYIYVDEANQVPEQNEVNNMRVVHLDVDETSAGDMILTGMHFEADGLPILGAGVGDLIDIVATLANVGTATVSTPMVVRAYNGPYVPGAEPIGDIQPRLNGMEASGERLIEIPWRPLEGLHTIYLVVMPQDPVTTLDFNNHNNMTWAELEITDHPTVDLYVEEIFFIIDGQVATQASEGNNVHTLAIISNDGSMPYRGMVEVDVYRGDPDAGGLLVGKEMLIADIDPDENLEVEFDWRAELGTHAVTIFIDPGNTIYESDEDNNQLGRGLTVSRHPLPDLTVGSMSLLLNGEELNLTEGTNAGANVEVNISVLNMGTEKTKSVSVTTLYLGNPLLGGTLLGSFEVPEGLNPDEVLVASIYWKAEKPKQKSDTPVLFVRVDSTGVEPEVNEFNNDDLRPLPVGASLPDLTIVSMSITDMNGAPVESITYGTSIKIEVIITNVGTDISFQVAQLDLYLDVIDEATRLSTMGTSTLDIGETVSKTTTWSPDPLKVDGGDHPIIAVVDPLNDITESSDANNDIIGTIHVDGDALPNLLPMDIWVTVGDRTVDRLDENDKGTIHLRIVNLGEAPLFTPASIELFHGEPTQGGVAVEIWQITDLEVGANASYQKEWTFENDLPLVLYIDRNNMVEETNENDNFGTATVDVDPPPDGANFLVIGIMIGIALLVLVIMTLIIGRRPTGPPPEEEEGPETPVEEVPEEVPEEPVEDIEVEVSEEVTEAAPEAAPEAPAEIVAETPQEVTEEPSEEPEAVVAATCPHCGEEVDQDWILCPFCDKALK